MKDLVPWVPPISSHPLDWEEEEEDDEMSNLIHNFATQNQKQESSFERAADAIPGMAGGSVGLSRTRVWRCQQLSSQVRLKWV